MKQFLFFSFFLVISTIQAQEIKLNGTVKDSIGIGIEMANVIAINMETKVLESFGITNHKGLFKLALKTDNRYQIRVSYIGFKTEEFVITAPGESFEKEIRLQEETNQLEGVEVTYEIPVSIKGDTIVYNTDSFITGTERKLKDVLENLPGVEINDDGEIEIEGKTVSKVMVEGKDFFDGDTKIAVENIPANALDKIEVLRNFNEVSQMKGITNDTDNVAINIRLKEGKKNFWFGEVTAGYGPDNKYLAHPKLFYYSPKYSINIITDLNNIGEVPFTRRDYRNFSGGFNNISRRGGSSVNLGSDAIGLSTTQNNRAKDIDTKFAAVNFSYSPIKTWDISGFGIYSYTGTIMEEQANTLYNVTGVEEDALTKTDQSVKLGMVKFSSLYKPNANLQVDYDILLKMSDDEEAVDVLSVIADQSDNVNQLKQQKPLSVNQNFTLYYTLNDKHIFAAAAQYTYQDEDPFYSTIREEFAFVNLFPVDENQSNYNSNQNKKTVTNKLDVKVDYYYVTGPKSNLNFTLGTTQSKQDFSSSIFQILDDETELTFTGDDFINDVSYKVSDVYGAFHYKVISGIFTFNPGLTLHQFKTTNTQLGNTVTDNLTSLLPDMYVNVQLKKSENLRFTYRMARSFTDINKFAKAYVINNYNSVYSGNRDLESALSHNLSLNFFSFNMFNFTNISGNVSYIKTIDALKSNVATEGINSIRTTINSPYNDESLSLMGRYERTFGKIKGSFRGNLSWFKTNNLVHDPAQNIDVQQTSESLTQNYTLSMGTQFKNTPNIELGYRYTINDYNNQNSSNIYYTKRPFAKFDTPFLKSFIFTADYEFYKYTDDNNTVENSYSFLAANLNYQKKDSKWEFAVKGINLLNTQFINTNRETNFYIATTSYEVQPRYLIFTVKYNL